MVRVINKNQVLKRINMSEEWENLIGENLDNWKGYKVDSIAGWKIEDGVLFASGDGSDASGYILTRKQYENFELELEWKIAEGGNSGILYHVLESGNLPTPYLSGPEYQLIDDIGFPGELEEWQKGRRRLCNVPS